jgi:hypothetical protein
VQQHVFLDSFDYQDIAVHERRHSARHNNGRDTFRSISCGVFAVAAVTAKVTKVIVDITSACRYMGPAKKKSPIRLTVSTANCSSPPRREVRCNEDGHEDAKNRHQYPRRRKVQTVEALTSKQPNEYLRAGQKQGQIKDRNGSGDSRPPCFSKTKQRRHDEGDVEPDSHAPTYPWQVRGQGLYFQRSNEFQTQGAFPQLLGLR